LAMVCTDTTQKIVKEFEKYKYSEFLKVSDKLLKEVQKPEPNEPVEIRCLFSIYVATIIRSLMYRDREGRLFLFILTDGMDKVIKEAEEVGMNRDKFLNYLRVGYLKPKKREIKMIEEVLNQNGY
jgi:hypothetical protein